MRKVSLSRRVVSGIFVSVIFLSILHCIGYRVNVVDNGVSKKISSATYFYNLFVLPFYKRFYPAVPSQSLIVKTVWGEETITDPCALELINSSLMQRLNHIDQSGPQSYFGINSQGESLIVPHFSRFEHSLGVYLLLLKAGVSHDEQIAGLMHDASHTVFSHVGDMVFGNGDGAKSYQDGIHIDYLRSYNDVRIILNSYGIHLEDMDPDKEEYTALERPLPDLCADRIQYIIHTGVILKCITLDHARTIVEDLEFKNGVWFFKSVETAYMFSSISLYCLQALWGGHVNAFFYLLFKHILLRALDLKLVTVYDLHYSTDQKILDILAKSDDQYIQRLLSYTQNWQEWYEVVPYDDSIIKYRIKFRGVNPFVLIGGVLQRLTDIFPKYAAEYEQEKKWCYKGYGLKLLFDLQV